MWPLQNWLCSSQLYLFSSVARSEPRVALLAKQKRNAFQRKIGNALPTNHAKSATAILAHGTVDHLIVKMMGCCCHGGQICDVERDIPSMESQEHVIPTELFHVAQLGVGVGSQTLIADFLVPLTIGNPSKMSHFVSWVTLGPPNTS